VAHGVHPATKKVEPARLDSPPDSPPADTRRHQLGPSDNPVLPPCERGDHQIGAKVAYFGTYTVLN
jgi:hypothetical protein